MFVKLTRLLSIAFLVASLTLFLTTPRQILGFNGDFVMDPGDCVMDPGEKCCH